MIVLLLLCIVPVNEPLQDNVDLIQLAHVHDKDNANHINTQWIFWEWVDGEYRIVDWRLDKGQGTIQKRGPHDYILTINDGGEGVRIVRAPSYRETWTQYDPEMRARQKHPMKDYRKLIRRRVSQ